MVGLKRPLLKRPKQTLLHKRNRCMTVNTVQVLRCTRWVQLFSKNISHGKKRRGKLDSNWIGPFTITRVLGKGWSCSMYI